MSPHRDRRIGRMLAARVRRGARAIITRSVTPPTAAERLADWRYRYELYRWARDGRWAR